MEGNFANTENVNHCVNCVEVEELVCVFMEKSNLYAVNAEVVPCANTVNGKPTVANVGEDPCVNTGITRQNVITGNVWKNPKGLEKRLKNASTEKLNQYVGNVEEDHYVFMEKSGLFVSIVEEGPYVNTENARPIVLTVEVDLCANMGNGKHTVPNVGVDLCANMVNVGADVSFVEEVPCVYMENKQNDAEIVEQCVTICYT